MTEFNLTEFGAAIRARAQQWESASIRWRLTFGPEREKSAAWVNCETDDLEGELIVWTTGEAEFTILNQNTGDLEEIHYDFTTTEDLVACLDELTHRLSQPTCPA